MKLEPSRRIFEKYIYIYISNFMKIRPVVAEFPCGQKDRRTDRNDEANSRFSQFRERA